MEFPDPGQKPAAAAESFGSVPHGSESFRTIPHDSASFRTVPHIAVAFRNVPNAAERKENHSLSVRDVVRMFEAAGVARAERSIVNWCQPNRQGVARLDAYLDPNERRYFITPESVDRAIEEEKSKRPATIPEPTTDPIREQAPANSDESQDELERRVRKLEALNRDLEIASEVKDKFIEQLEADRKEQISKLIELSHEVGKLGAQLKQLEGPQTN